MKNLLLIIGLILAIGCSQKPKVVSYAHSHIVLVWLKEADDLEKIKTASRILCEDIDEVKTYHIGFPAGTDRPIVDNSFDLCLTTYFESREDMLRYLEHPAHLNFLKQHGSKFEKVLVYDANSD